MCRLSIVKDVFVRSVTNAGTVVIGDGATFDGTEYVLAVKREVTMYRGNEGDLRPYPTYRAAVPTAPEPPPIELHIVNENPRIRVGRIDVLGVASAGLLQVGCLNCIRGESRTKQFRQLRPETTAAQGGVPRRVYAAEPIAGN